VLKQRKYRLKSEINKVRRRISELERYCK